MAESLGTIEPLDYIVAELFPAEDVWLVDILWGAQAIGVDSGNRVASVVFRLLDDHACIKLQRKLISKLTSLLAGVYGKAGLMGGCVDCAVLWGSVLRCMGDPPAVEPLFYLVTPFVTTVEGVRCA